MDIVVNKAQSFGFQRLSSKLDLPIVLHSVPGAGKSSLIRELIKDSRFEAYTFGEPDRPSVSGYWIRPHTELNQRNREKFILIDEYTEAGINLDFAYAVFGDPLQSDNKQVKRAHFVCKESRRFGKATAQLLQHFGFDVHSSGDDVVNITDALTVDPKGVIVYYEDEVKCLLDYNRVEAKHVREIRGKTFEEVTFITASNDLGSDPVAAFQCLTRHKVVLNIFCPDATYRPA